MNNNYNNHLPNINLTSIPNSIKYFQYTRDQLKNGDMNPNYRSLSYHPYHSAHQMNLDPTPYSKLFQRDSMVYSRVNAKNPFLDSYRLPSINNYNNNTIREIKDGEIVHFPDETLIPASKLNSFINTSRLPTKYNNSDINNNVQNKPVETLNLRDLRKKNKRHWKILKFGVYMLNIFFSLRKISKNSVNLKVNKLIYIQSAKEGLIQIKNFLLPNLSNIQKFCEEFFTTTLLFNKEDPEKCENTSFIVKSFIQQLFSDLSASSTFSSDIPDRIKKVMRNFISDKSLLPIGFLTTFEFNRLEFDTKGRLINMTGERKALLTCMIILYRVLLIDIFKKHFTHFPALREMKPNEKKIKEAILRRVDERKRKNIMKNKEELLKKKKIEINKLTRSKQDPFSKYQIPPNPPKKKRHKKYSESSSSSSYESSNESEDESSKYKKSRKKNKKKENLKQFWGEDLEDESDTKNEDFDEEVKKSKKKVKRLPEEEREEVIREETEKLRNIISHNFHFMINILHFIFINSLKDNVDIYHEDFKEKYYYRLYVFQKSNVYYERGNDDIELINGVILEPEKTMDFIALNERWLQMYKISVFGFCIDFAKKCLNE